jgi:hypothetical protein
MKGIIHPFTKALYEQDGTGNVRSPITRSGIFGTDGRWISGELRECDPQLCIGGRTSDRQPSTRCRPSLIHERQALVHGAGRINCPRAIP